MVGLRAARAQLRTAEARVAKAERAVERFAGQVERLRSEVRRLAVDRRLRGKAPPDEVTAELFELRRLVDELRAALAVERARSAFGSGTEAANRGLRRAAARRTLR